VSILSFLLMPDSSLKAQIQEIEPLFEWLGLEGRSAAGTFAKGLETTSVEASAAKWEMQLARSTIAMKEHYGLTTGTADTRFGHSNNIYNPAITYPESGKTTAPPDEVKTAKIDEEEYVASFRIAFNVRMSSKQINKNGPEILEQAADKLKRLGFANHPETWYIKDKSDYLSEFKNNLADFKNQYALPATAKWGSLTEKVYATVMLTHRRVLKFRKGGIEDGDVQLLARFPHEEYYVVRGSINLLVKVKIDPSKGGARVDKSQALEWRGLLNVMGSVGREVTKSVSGKKNCLYVEWLINPYHGRFANRCEARAYYGKCDTLFSLSKVAPYTDLLNKLVDWIKTSKQRNVVLGVPPLQGAGLVEASFDDSLVSACHGAVKIDSLFPNWLDGLFFVNVDRLAYDLSKKAGVPVFLATDLDGGRRKLAHLPDSIYLSRTRMFVPAATFKDLNVISEPILRQIQESGLSIEKIDIDDSLLSFLGSNVVVYSGTNIDALWEFLSRLGDKNMLRGKVLALYTCGESWDIYRYSTLIHKYGIQDIIRFPFRIDPVAARAVILRLGGHLDGKLLEVWQKTVQELLDNPDGFEENIPDIEKLQYPIHMISLNKLDTEVNAT